MDVVGLASSIISFIEVAHKIVSGSYEIYKSSTGATKDHDHTARVLDDLSRVAHDLQRQPGKANDEQLLRLSEGCLELSGDLKRLLDKFLPKGPGPWQAFKAACRSLRKQVEAAAMESRLDRYRQQISQRLILLLLYVPSFTCDDRTITMIVSILDSSSFAPSLCSRDECSCVICTQRAAVSDQEGTGRHSPPWTTTIEHPREDDRGRGIPTVQDH